MKPVFVFVLALVLMLHASHSAAQYQCGVQGSGAVCALGDCCSQWGWCGSGPDFCGRGCQSGACSPSSSDAEVSLDGTCGPSSGGKICRAGYCCSGLGWCGATDLHCGAGCQSGPCTDNSTVVTPSLPPTQQNNARLSIDGSCGPQHNNTICPDNYCCSAYGWCGNTQLHCGVGCISGACLDVPCNITLLNGNTEINPTNNNDNNNDANTVVSMDGACGGNKVCREGYCCSAYGWCGNTDLHCGMGCQSGACKNISNTIDNNNNVNVSIDGSCGPQHDNTVCPSGYCCSKFGYCGSTALHCGTGCISGACINQPNNTNNNVPTYTPICNISTSNLTTDGSCGIHKHCAQGYCCSKYGWCGDTPSHCGSGCQSGACNYTDNQNTLTISTDGKCGYNNTICPDNYCCSSYGWCGNNESYCGVGCQSGACINATELTNLKGAYCGDLICNGNETCALCQYDCGICPPTDAQVYTDCHSDYSTNKFVLTFDDGPVYGVTDKLLDLLKEENVKATFFVVGSMVDANSAGALVQRAQIEGHEVLSHSYSHPTLTTLSTEQQREEISKTEYAIRSATCKRFPRYIRPPYGEYDTRTLNNLHSWGYRAVTWNMDSEDYLYVQQSDGVEVIVNKTIALIDSMYPKSIIALHHDLYYTVVDAMKQIIRHIKDKGYEFITVPECLLGPIDSRDINDAATYNWAVNHTSYTCLDHYNNPIGGYPCTKDEQCGRGRCVFDYCVCDIAYTCNRCGELLSNITLNTPCPATSLD